MKKKYISALTFPMTNLRVCCVCKLSLSGPAADRESLSLERYEMQRVIKLILSVRERHNKQLLLYRRIKPTQTPLSY